MSNDNPNQIIDDRIYYIQSGILHSESIDGGNFNDHSKKEFEKILKNNSLELDDLNNAFVEEYKKL